jgi:hypothetical protein
MEDGQDITMIINRKKNKYKNFNLFHVNYCLN